MPSNFDTLLLYETSIAPNESDFKGRIVLCYWLVAVNRGSGNPVVE